MNRRSLGLLVVLNIVLALALLVVVTTPKQAAAQAGFGGRGEYIMLSGRLEGGVRDLVYIVDVRNGKIAAVTFDEHRSRLNVQGTADLAQDMANGGGGGGR